ncbi:MAG: hypothetical protein ACI8TA_002867, partial [Cyclobacteriaceae bacterium]
MRKITLTLTMLMLVSFQLSAQDDEGKKKLNIKPPKFNIGEKLGKLAGNIMTGKTAELEVVSIKMGMVCGIYPPEIKTSEVKFYPESTREGDFSAYISFFKMEGVGMLEIDGEVLCDGEPMGYVGLGSYAKVFNIPPSKPVNISVKTITGDEASFSLTTIPGVEIVTVNGETALPILDLDNDIELVYTNPPGSENTRIRVSLITDVMGARALNHFADFPVTKVGDAKVTIPKEALANPEIAGQLNAGQFNKGENWIIVERERIQTKDDYSSDQKVGQVATSEIKTTAYASLPVIVKGKQDEGIMATLKITGQSANKTLGYEFYKPNATTGIPMSKASKFGLVSFNMTANTFKEETEKSSS